MLKPSPIFKTKIPILKISPQNYQATQNTQNASIVPPIPQKTTFQIPIPNEPHVGCSELDHYKEQERESGGQKKR